MHGNKYIIICEKNGRPRTTGASGDDERQLKRLAAKLNKRFENRRYYVDKTVDSSRIIEG